MKMLCICIRVLSESCHHIYKRMIPYWSFNLHVKTEMITTVSPSA